ncbi:MAG: excinuclease subunit [Fusobacteriaceae bacterium]|nr:excinuclease subunit [Fusobacteriaceae bacterium]
MSNIELNEFPDMPGVYLMKNNNKKIIYIGKAKNLRKRVSSYFQKKHDRKKTEELVKNIDSIDYILCKTELDALILENNLIKKHKPKYNIALKDSKTYPYLFISNEKFPKISIIRNTKYLNKDGDYFGPYPGTAFELIKIIKKIFMIRDCNRDMNKKYDRPCLKYYMKMCLGPCVYKEIEEKYNENKEQLKLFLKGNYKDVLNSLEETMNYYSEKMDFETAIIYREKIKNVKNAMKNQIIEYGKEIDEDVFLVKEEYGNIFIQVLNIRNGIIIGKNEQVIDIENNIEDSSIEELFLDLFIQYYNNYVIPKNLILDKKFKNLDKMIKEWSFSEKKIKVNIYYPEIKSRRKELLEMGYLNLEKEIKNFYNRKTVLETGIKNLFTILKLKKIPRRIECFDISNIQGKDAVASMSVALEGKAAKKEYRRFKIKTKDTPDDFHMMREVLFRRYSKLSDNELPDLILIDGGKGQLNSAAEILQKVGKLDKIDLISIAKREEEIFKYGETLPYIISKRDETLKILQRLRDEAHRFGITYHRKLRSKRIISSELDKIEGIGPKRKEKLLKKYKSIENIKKQSLVELKSILPEKIAITLYNSLNNERSE